MSLHQSVENYLLETRTLFLDTDIDDESIGELIRNILYLDQQEEDITLYINSDGGFAESGLALYDVMIQSRSDIKTICIGAVKSMASVLFCAGTKGKRFIGENAAIMIHQPSIKITGNYDDILIKTERMTVINKVLSKIIAHHTGQTRKTIAKDMVNDFWMSPEQAIKYGIADKIYKGDNNERGY